LHCPSAIWLGLPQRLAEVPEIIPAHFLAKIVNKITFSPPMAETGTHQQQHTRKYMMIPKLVGKSIITIFKIRIYIQSYLHRFNFAVLCCTLSCLQVSCLLWFTGQLFVIVYMSAVCCCLQLLML
jgi:hypothetical protein